MRTALATLAALATACCFEPGDVACVVPRSGNPYCHFMHGETICWTGGEQAPPLSRDYRGCEGEVHDDVDCADLGFTVPCGGGAYFVRPGGSC
ncbi:MAG TPA: hypothetical protein VIW03_06410 [Anaeromyxobacter sp.]